MSGIRPADIVSLAALCPRRAMLGRVACTSGGFDPLHPGHVKLLLSAKEYSDCFVVFVSGDEFLRRKKGRPFMEHMLRCEIVAGVRGVDYVIPYENEPDLTVSLGLRQLRPDVFLKGGDRVDRKTIPEWDLCESLGIEIVVPDNCKDTPSIGAIPCHGEFFLDRWVKGAFAEVLGESRKSRGKLYESSCSA